MFIFSDEQNDAGHVMVGPNLIMGKTQRVVVCGAKEQKYIKLIGGLGKNMMIYYPNI